MDDFVTTWYSERDEKWIWFWKDCYGIAWRTDKYIAGDSRLKTLFTNRIKLTVEEAELVLSNDRDMRELTKYFG